jgi:hypothetical protein
MFSCITQHICNRGLSDNNTLGLPVYHLIAANKMREGLPKAGKLTHLEMRETATPFNAKGKPRWEIEIPRTPGCAGGLLSTKLGLLDDDGVFFTNLHAAFAAQALFGVNGFGFPVFHFKYLSGTDINTLFAANAFVLIHDRIKSHDQTPFKIIFH